MRISINVDEDIPLFQQLVEQVKQAVMSGGVRPGDALPSIRQLANDLDINNKTVAKAYRMLERDNVIETKGYRGTFVHPEAKSNAVVDLTGWVQSELTQLVKKLKDAGITDSEIRIAFGDVMNDRAIIGATK